MTLIIEGGYAEFTDFFKAISWLQDEYGYEGLGWNMIVASEDFEILEDFLASEGIITELIN